MAPNTSTATFGGFPHDDDVELALAVVREELLEGGSLDLSCQALTPSSTYSSTSDHPRRVTVRRPWSSCWGMFISSSDFALRRVYTAARTSIPFRTLAVQVPATKTVGG